MPKLLHNAKKNIEEGRREEVTLQIELNMKMKNEKE